VQFIRPFSICGQKAGRIGFFSENKCGVNLSLTTKIELRAVMVGQVPSFVTHWSNAWLFIVHHWATSDARGGSME
jgi:hypothetical protein